MISIESQALFFTRFAESKDDMEEFEGIYTKTVIAPSEHQNGACNIV